LRPRQGERAQSKKFFWPVSHFLHQNETTAGWQDPKIKFSLKINSPYCAVVSGAVLTCLAWIYVRLRYREIDQPMPGTAPVYSQFQSLLYCRYCFLSMD
jgi:hypothetical protein